MEFQICGHLICEDQAVLHQARDFRINNFLEAVPKVRREFLNAESWQGHGMGQASLPRMIRSRTRVRIVTRDRTRYCDIFVIALALFYRLPNLRTSLEAEYAEAAFQLCNALYGVDDMLARQDDNKEKAKSAMPTPSDAQHISLVPNLLDCWKNARGAMDAAHKEGLLKDILFV